ncbi:type IV pilus assembly protein PilM [Nocardioides sp. GXZ039]|uniref:type IV pilus assembly protein PilM n=1 Tax=Nocardioides sp. GXZ039 TaxID=3136018 RepID=UPI0030F379A2
MPSTVVGLDIGTSSVRAVEVSGRGRSAKVRKGGRVELPAGAVEGGQLRNPAEVTKAVRRLWHEQRFSSKDVRIGVGSGSVLVRPVELDWMPAQDLKKAMRYLVADLLPVPVDEANIDHVVLGEFERDDKRMVRVLLVATARDGVDEVVRAVQAAGLRPVAADLAPLALVRAAMHNPGVEGRAGTEAVVDVGAEKISVIIHSAGLPRFVRVIPGIGGHTLTQALSEATGEDAATSELRKRAAILDAPDQVSAVVRLAAQRLANEIRDTLRFYTAADADNPPDRVLLTGLGAANRGFAELVAATTGLPSHILPAPTAGRRNGGSQDIDLTVSYGLCLGVPA